MHAFGFHEMLSDGFLGGLIGTLILFWFCRHTKHSADQKSSYSALLERLESTYTKDAGIESWKNVLHEGEN